MVARTEKGQLGRFVLMLVSVLLLPSVATADALGGIEWLVNKRFDVPEITAEEAQAILSDDAGNWLVVDVREPEEYAVSHLPGAIRISLDTDRETFTQQFGGALAGKHVLFYCSVGQRSSKLAARLQDAVRDAGGADIANLRGGIFRWHGEHGTLVNAEGSVGRIHPYNAVWGRLMPRENPPDPTIENLEDTQ